MRPREVIAISAANIDTSPTTVAIAASDTFGMTQADVDKTIDIIRASNVRAVPLFIPRAGVEYTQGQRDRTAIDRTVNSAAARGLAVVGIVNLTPPWAVTPGQVNHPSITVLGGALGSIVDAPQRGSRWWKSSSPTHSTRRTDVRRCLTCSTAAGS